MESKKTLVLGASSNPLRYSYKAIRRLLDKEHEVLALGNREGQVEGIEIHTTPFLGESIDTITLYLNPYRQKAYYDYILALRPRRIIFNPGTENPELVALAKAAGIESEIACTLVLLAIDQY